MILFKKNICLYVVALILQVIVVNIYCYCQYIVLQFDSFPSSLYIYIYTVFIITAVSIVFQVNFVSCKRLFLFVSLTADCLCHDAQFCCSRF